MENFTAAQEIKSQWGQALVKESVFMGETTLEIREENLFDVLSSLKNAHGFAVLMDLTGVDYLHPEKRTKVIYFLHHPANYQRLRVAVYVPREGSLPSTISLWEGANWYERELFDLFGIHFRNHPDLTRILMPDDWRGHPLLRDYPLTEVPVEFKYGVKPKIPSEIIPHVKINRK